MEQLKAYIEGRGKMPMQDVAAHLGVSRPYLYDLLGEKRQPSLVVALRIQAATNGKVSLQSWNKFSEIADALSHEATQ
jgi:AcrR family transcriptional regulator